MNVYRIDLVKEEEIKEIISFAVEEALLRCGISGLYDSYFLSHEIFKKLKDKNK